MTNNLSTKKKKGFTLIEVLIAVFILVTAVVVPLTIGAKAFAYSNFVRDQSIASYLAQDAMEYVRLQRDNASLRLSTSGAWQEFTSTVNDCTFGGGCLVNTLGQGSIRPCDGRACPPLVLQPDGTYSYETSGAVASSRAFTRTVRVEFLDTGSSRERARVEVDISWNTNGVDARSFTIVNYLTPWQI